MFMAAAPSSNDGVCLAHKAETIRLRTVWSWCWHSVSSVPVSSREKLGAEFKPPPNQLDVTPNRVLEKEGCYLGFLQRMPLLSLASLSQQAGTQDPNTSQPVSITPPHIPLRDIDVPRHGSVGWHLGCGTLQLCQPHLFHFTANLQLLVQQPHCHLVLRPAVLLHQALALLTPIPHTDLQGNDGPWSTLRTRRDLSAGNQAACCSLCFDTLISNVCMLRSGRHPQCAC